MKKEVLAVKIKNAVHKDGKDYYEATKGDWRAARDRVRKVEYVIGVLDKEVVCVYKPLVWETVEKNGRKRQRFEGKEVDKSTFNTFKDMQDDILKGFGVGASISYKQI
ncbi:hypothetical protein [Peribacillus deserti]|uniref:Uncharacterized protein n=1 Tax=Peribacillus deserti TaxID=673318 RepID=A0A2N5M9M2_9BACI|nr:hypothetical protein [Peribacillus deserti]PLT31023.1 hypothetical protein CUU66_04245 [Peribacillus deserti]